MSTLTLRRRADAPAGTRPTPRDSHRLPALARRTLAWIARLLSARRAARQLAELDDRMLRDIGLRRSGSGYIEHWGCDIVALTPPPSAPYLDALSGLDGNSFTSGHD